MLPDFPDLKTDLTRRLGRRVTLEVANDPLLSRFPSFQMHEGLTIDLHRADGSTETIAFDKPIGATASIKVNDIRKSGVAASLAAVSEIAAGLQQGMAERTFASIEKAVERVGNSLDVKGKPLSPDMILEMYSRMQLSFDDDGLWEPPTIVTGPDLEKRAQEAHRQIEEVPELRARRDAIVERQRAEWRVRENSRKLAD